MQANAIEQLSEYMTAADVRKFFGGVSHMWLVRRLADSPDFPRPIKLAPFRPTKDGRDYRPRFWRADEIRAWVHKRAVQS